MHDVANAVNSFNLSNSPSSLRKQDAYAQKMTDLELALPYTHWCDAPAVLDRLQYVMVQLTNKLKRSNFKFSKAFFVAVFALYDVGRGIALDDGPISIEFVFPDIYIKMNDEERKRFAGHALRMFEGFLEHHDLAKTASRSYDVSARLVDLARFLLSFLPKPRRSIATQTDAD